MASIILTTIIVIAIALVAVALLVWMRQKGEKREGISREQKKAFFAQFVIGIVVAIIAAAFMFDGHILGEDTTGISTVLGITAIGLIATSNFHLLPFRRE